jgi:Asp-tRNA(Asn)/Glu-tRNA(Gln) amidotransferase A subunit family amidase
LAEKEQTTTNVCQLSNFRYAQDVRSPKQSSSDLLGSFRDNLPAGIVFLGRPYDDAMMIELAFGYEQATRHRRPPKTTP